RASTAGRPTVATTTRETRGVMSGPAGSAGGCWRARRRQVGPVGPLRPLAPAEAAPAAGVVVEGCAELLLAEVGPERVDEDELGVRELPQEEVRDPQLAGGPDQQIRVRHLGGAQKRREHRLVSLAPGPNGAVRGLDDLRAASVVERDPEIETTVALGLALQRGHAVAERVRRAVAAPDEAGPHTLAHEVRQLPLDRLREDLHEE